VGRAFPVKIIGRVIGQWWLKEGGPPTNLCGSLRALSYGIMPEMVPLYESYACCGRGPNHRRAVPELYSRRALSASCSQAIWGGQAARFWCSITTIIKSWFEQSGVAHEMMGRAVMGTLTACGGWFDGRQRQGAVDLAASGAGAG